MTTQNTFLCSQGDYLETDTLIRSILNTVSVVLFLYVYQECHILLIQRWSFQSFYCLQEEVIIFFKLQWIFDTEVEDYTVLLIYFYMLYRNIQMTAVSHQSPGMSAFGRSIK